MERICTTLAALLFGLLFGSAAIATAADVASQPAPSAADAATESTELTPSADELVRAAVEAGLAADALKRDELRQALAADPDYAPARWFSGEVKFGGKWRTLEEVERLVTTDPRWARYAELRHTSTNTPDGHLDLARWCMREGLDNEEQLHWKRVLRANPKHELARARLGVREYSGGLYTDEQIAAREEQLEEAHGDFAKFAPIISEICNRAAKGSTEERDRALLELRQIDDARAILAMETAVSSAAQQAGPELARDLARSMVVAFSNMSDHAATQRLLYYSLMADDAEVRKRAAEALAPRPVTDYVPQLMAALQAPVQAAIMSSAMPDGGAGFAAYFYQKGPLADFTASKVITANAYTNGGNFGLDGVGPRARAMRVRLRYNAQVMEHVTQQRVAMTNMAISVRNARVREALFNALNIDFGPDPQTYWQEWTSYNDLYLPEHPVISLANGYERYEIPTCSCFALGTPVWTQAGPVPIERIAVGDLVLSQNPETGELAFREVLERTVRPPTKMARVAAGDSAVEATLGHRFWINGKGWEMTKFLAPGNSLHTLDGPAELTALEPLQPNEITEAYNLVVDDFHTYVVGEGRIVVHDNTCPRPVTLKTPGLTP
jgi:hypothetical protein